MNSDNLTKMYFKDAKAALLVYDITDERSFEKIKSWTILKKNNSSE